MTLDSYYADDLVARTYDDVERITSDIPFYVDLAREAASCGTGVLELGCGTGRVTLPVAQAGVHTTGLDSSAQMLAVARERAQSAGLDVRWVQGDMASFSFEQRFGLIMVPCRTFLMLTSVEQQKSCLACIRDHLADGGRLALNIFNPDLTFIAKRLARQTPEWDRMDNGGLALREYHTSEQLLIETRQESFDDTPGGPVSRTLRIRYVFRYEMQYLLELCGFEVEALYGGFHGQPFSDSSGEMVWVARKA